MANASVIDPDTNRLDLSLSGSYSVKVSSLRDLEVQSRDMIRILSHANFFICGSEIPAKWKYGLEGFYENLKSISMAIMDIMSMATVQTLGLQ